MRVPHLGQYTNLGVKTTDLMIKESTNCQPSWLFTLHCVIMGSGASTQGREKKTDCENIDIKNLKSR